MAPSMNVDDAMVSITGAGINFALGSVAMREDQETVVRSWPSVTTSNAPAAFVGMPIDSALASC
jgi:hypothetical protein